MPLSSKATAQQAQQAQTKMKNRVKGLDGRPPASPLDVQRWQKGSRDRQRAPGGMCSLTGCIPPAAKAVLGSVPCRQRWQDGSGNNQHCVALTNFLGVLPLSPPERGGDSSVRATVSAVREARDTPSHCCCAPHASTRAGWILMSRRRSSAVEGGGRPP
jgi:hypothetical protein